MKSFLSPNLDKRGRWVRIMAAVLVFLGAGFAFTISAGLAVVLAASGAFVLFEALRGWCVLRACGIKTKL